MEQSPIPSRSLSDDRNITSLLLAEKVTTRNKRQLQTSPGTSPISKHLKVAVQKQKTSLVDMIATKKSVPAAAPKITIKTNIIRSIYVASFDPATNPSDIISHLESNEELKHIVPNIVCKKLAGKNRRRHLSFVSFKLDVLRHHFELIVNSQIWPQNDEFTVKEFIDKRANYNSSSGNDANPFSKPVNAQSQNKNQQPFNIVKGRGGRRHRVNRVHTNDNWQQS